MDNYIMGSISNEKFKHDFLGDHLAWGTSFVEYPGPNQGMQWTGGAVNGSFPLELDDPDANNFMSVSSFVDHAMGRKQKNWHALHFLMLDDVGTKVPESKVSLPPSCKIETSPGNYQYLYRLETPCTDIGLVKKLLQEIGDRGLTDPDGNSLVRYARLPIGSNTKPKHGKPFKHKVVEYDPQKTYSIEELCSGLGLSDTSIIPSTANHLPEKKPNKYGVEKSTNKTLLIDALSRIHPEPYQVWMKVGMALYFEFGGCEEGFDLWNKWSTKSSKYQQQEMHSKWASFDESTLPDQAKPITGATIITMGKHTLTFEYISQQIDETDEINDLITSVADMVTDSYLKQVQKYQLRKRIAKKTGNSLNALKADAKEREKGSNEETQIDIARQVMAFYSANNLIYQREGFHAWQGKGVWERIDEKEIRKIVHDMVSEQKLSGGVVDSILKLISTEAFDPDITFDKEFTGINCPNGELHMDNGAWVLREHNRENFALSQIPVPYDPEATAPRFDQFIAEVFDGDDDALEKRQLLLEMVGYTLLASCRFEKFIILIGGGANGKSVMMSVISALVGPDCVAAVPPEKLGNNFQRAFLCGKLANLVTEIPEGSIIEDASVKALVSGDLMTAEEKHKPPFNFRPYATCWFGTNHMPHTRDFSDGLFRRAYILPFNNRFDGADCDPALTNKLRQELSGILNIVLGAIASVIEQGKFTEPPSMIAAVKKWRVEADQVWQFVEDCCELSHGEVKKSGLFKSYQMWAEEQCIRRTLSHKSFTNRLELLGVEERREGKARYYTGIRLAKGEFLSGVDHKEWGSKL
jgi:P4 family phage/plasmid primase-like protien